MSKSAKTSDQSPHFVLSDKHPILAKLSAAYLDINALLLELETTLRAAVQRRSELLESGSKHSQEEKERRGLEFYSWVIRLHAAGSEIRPKINALIQVLNEAKKFDSPDNLNRDHNLWQQLNLNIITATSFLQRALAAFGKSNFQISDATLEAWLSQLVYKAAEKAALFAGDIPLLPEGDDQHSRETALMLSEVVTSFHDKPGTGKVCFSMRERESAAYAAAKLLRSKGWGASPQEDVSPGMTQGLEVKVPKRK